MMLAKITILSGAFIVTVFLRFIYSYGPLKSTGRQSRFLNLTQRQSFLKIDTSTEVFLKIDTATEGFLKINKQQLDIGDKGNG